MFKSNPFIDFIQCRRNLIMAHIIRSPFKDIQPPFAIDISTIHPIVILCHISLATDSINTIPIVDSEIPLHHIKSQCFLIKSSICHKNPTEEKPRVKIPLPSHEIFMQFSLYPLVI